MTLAIPTASLEERVLADGGQDVLDAIAGAEISSSPTLTLMRLARRTGLTPGITESRVQSLVTNGYAISPHTSLAEVMTHKIRLTEKGWAASKVKRPFWKVTT